MRDKIPRLGQYVRINPTLAGRMKDKCLYCTTVPYTGKILQIVRIYEAQGAYFITYRTISPKDTAQCSREHTSRITQEGHLYCLDDGPEFFIPLPTKQLRLSEDNNGQ